jgi:CheY-like chemotaxis protein
VTSPLLSDRRPEPSTRPGDAGAPEPGRKVLLLADDEPPVRVTARRFLQRAGFHVLEAHDGVDALARWDEAAGAVDVLVTDAQMPRLHGYDLAARLREHRPGLPVVVISGYADTAELVSTLGPGDATLRFVEKPFTGPQLVDTVRAVLEAAHPPAPRPDDRPAPGHGA